MTVKLGRETAKTPVVKKSLDPVFKSELVLHAEHRGAIVEVTVEDYDEMSGNDFMGRVKIPLAQVCRPCLVMAWRVRIASPPPSQRRGIITATCCRARRCRPSSDVV